VEIRSPGNVKPSWPVVTFPIDETSGVADLTIDPKTELWLAGVWPFAPPADYSPANAPFLPWIARPFPHFVVEGSVLLPVSTSRCEDHPCAVRIEYLAERGRDFSLALEGGPRRSFAFGDLAVPEWRFERIATGTPGTASVRIEPQGTTPILVRRLAAEASRLPKPEVR
jgi:hypothetical protein